MLSLVYLRENRIKAKEGLAKRNFLHPEIIDQTLEIDQNRRALQTQLDEVLSKSNQLAKDIGVLFKSGKIVEANNLKIETSSLKIVTKDLHEQIQKIKRELISLRTQIPIIPEDIVPSGYKDENNEEVFCSGSTPKFHHKVLPLWELAEK